MDNLNYQASRQGETSEHNIITVDFNHRRHCLRRIRLVALHVWERHQTFTVTFPEPIAVESEKEAAWLL